jgi:hypothetical protein
MLFHLQRSVWRTQEVRAKDCKETAKYSACILHLMRGHCRNQYIVHSKKLVSARHASYQDAVVLVHEFVHLLDRVRVTFLVRDAVRCRESKLRQCEKGAGELEPRFSDRTHICPSGSWVEGSPASLLECTYRAARCQASSLRDRLRASAAAASHPA